MKIPVPALFSGYFASTHVMACLFDLNTKDMVWCNDAFKHSMGYAEPQKTKTSLYFWRHRIHADDWPLILHICKCIRNGRDMCAGVFRLRCTGLHEHWVCGLFYHVADLTDSYLFIRLFESCLIVNTPEQLQTWIHHIKGSHPVPEIHRLTRTELLVLCLLAKGMTHVEIAHQLHRSLHTIRTHVAHIKEKFQLHHTSQLIALAHRMGISEDTSGNQYLSDQNGYTFF
ncbi:helix-turn-helix transcriptional regulator [Thermoflavifilum thermophilum]|uniref:Regulatory protein, luxR family n=1 Tax=Thermoflavifilum thermophilum TaxID=1393122 RepID=A0A1I7N450_9BACT|nr:LuxR C-terminal-related transcriptional regulator [Thermoflavifilum thermophilum]SFV29376.1 regulatory protein, luxR family [Thermoflavifilum thermophilum]